MTMAQRAAFMAAVLFGMTLATAGCGLLGLAMDEKSGPDAKMGGALPIELDTPVDERVSPVEGDGTDWRMFELEQETVVTVHIYWDSPDDLDASLLLRGTSASVSKGIQHVQSKRHEKIGPVRLEKGKWFVRVQAKEGATVYTLQVSKGAGGGGSGGGGDLPDF